MAKQNVVESLKAKVALIIEDNIRLRNEYDTLSEQNEKLRTENRELKLQTADLERKISRLELGKSFLGNDENKKKAKQRINQLMREIDKCIALMNE